MLYSHERFIIWKLISKMVARASWGLLASLCVGGAAGLALPTRALAGRPVMSGAAAHPLLHAAAVGPRHAPVVAQEGESKKAPFFLDIGTKGGIIFWSIVGIGAPFIVYNYLQDQMGMDVVRTRTAASFPRLCYQPGASEL